MDDTLTTGTTAVSPPTAWPVAGLLVDALTRRDFADLAACFEPEVRMRAVLPRAVIDLQGAETVAAKFAEWFGGSDRFEVLDASAGLIGPRQYVRWRVRMWPADRTAGSRIIEQHAFTRGGDRVESLDLLCSGFHAEEQSAGGAR